jgi:hypothetical protein
MAGVPLDHVTARAMSVFPDESLVTAVSCCVAPAGMLADAGLTITDATARSFPVF